VEGKQGLMGRGQVKGLSMSVCVRQGLILFYLCPCVSHYSPGALALTVLSKGKSVY
jgi:hypothetical protein